jgi:hypothetical protein
LAVGRQFSVLVTVAEFFPPGVGFMPSAIFTMGNGWGVIAGVPQDANPPGHARWAPTGTGGRADSFTVQVSPGVTGTYWTYPSCIGVVVLVTPGGPGAQDNFGPTDAVQLPDDSVDSSGWGAQMTLPEKFSCGRLIVAGVLLTTVLNTHISVVASTGTYWHDDGGGFTT